MEIRAISSCTVQSGGCQLSRTQRDAQLVPPACYLNLLAALALSPVPTSWQQHPWLLLALILQLGGWNRLKTPEQEPGSKG